MGGQAMGWAEGHHFIEIAGARRAVGFLRGDANRGHGAMLFACDGHSTKASCIGCVSAFAHSCTFSSDTASCAGHAGAALSVAGAHGMLLALLDHFALLNHALDDAVVVSCSSGSSVSMSSR